MSKDFNGNMKDVEVMEILKLARNTYYKYKKEISIESYTVNDDGSLMEVEVTSSKR